VPSEGGQVSSTNGKITAEQFHRFRRTPFDEKPLPGWLRQMGILVAFGKVSSACVPRLDCLRSAVGIRARR
jgi:hypothetical protein